MSLVMVQGNAENIFSSERSVLTAFKMCTSALRHSYRLVAQGARSFSDRVASLLGSGASTIKICGIRHSKLEQYTRNILIKTNRNSCINPCAQFL